MRLSLKEKNRNAPQTVFLAVNTMGTVIIAIVMINIGGLILNAEEMVLYISIIILLLAGILLLSTCKRQH